MRISSLFVMFFLTLLLSFLYILCLSLTVTKKQERTEFKTLAMEEHT